MNRFVMFLLAIASAFLTVKLITWRRRQLRIQEWRINPKIIFGFVIVTGLFLLGAFGFFDSAAPSQADSKSGAGSSLKSPPRQESVEELWKRIRSENVVPKK